MLAGKKKNCESEGKHDESTEPRKQAGKTHVKYKILLWLSETKGNQKHDRTFQAGHSPLVKSVVRASVQQPTFLFCHIA